MSLSPLPINFKIQRHLLNFDYYPADLVTANPRQNNLRRLIKRSIVPFTKSNNPINFNLIASFQLREWEDSAIMLTTHTNTHTRGLLDCVIVRRNKCNTLQRGCQRQRQKRSAHRPQRHHQVKALHNNPAGALEGSFECPSVECICSLASLGGVTRRVPRLANESSLSGDSDETRPPRHPVPIGSGREHWVGWASLQLLQHLGENLPPSTGSLGGDPTGLENSTNRAAHLVPAYLQQVRKTGRARGFMTVSDGASLKAMILQYIALIN